MSANIEVIGLDEVNAKLAMLRRSAQNKAIRPALTKGARILAKGMKAAVPAKFKDAKAAIGFRVKLKGDEVIAKVGASVGIKKEKLEKQIAKQGARRGGRPGVGISAANIHWFIFWTAERQTGTTRVGSNSHKRGATPQRILTGGASHRTGRMPPQMGPVKQGFAASEGIAMEAIRTTALERIDQLAAK